MATIVSILSTDIIANSRADINTNFSNLNTDKIEIGGVNGTPTRGDIVVATTATPTWNKLALGSAGKILRSDGTDLVYSTLTMPDTAAVSTILYASASNTIAALATGNSGVLITSGTGVPSISSTIPTATQDNITRLGTIVSGTWTAGVVGPAYGGTGVANNAASTWTISGNFATTVTVTATTGVTLPTSGTLVNTAVTTLSSLASIGTITTGVWTGTAIAVANGGTGATSASITAFNNITGYTAAGATGTTSTNLVFSTSPSLTTPDIGVATATSVNKVAITAPTTSATLTIADGKTLTASNTLTFTGTDTSSVAFGAGGTVVYTTVTSLSSLATVGTVSSGTWSSTITSATVSNGLTWSASQNFGAFSHYINDTANANMTTGLTINQGAADNQILTFKSSDVAHGVTTSAETDTYAFFQKVSGDGGGLSCIALQDANAANAITYQMEAIAGVAANTTKSTAGFGVMNFNIALANGTGTQAIGADGNMVSFRSNGTTRFLLDVEGSSHQDVGTAWIEYDDYNDGALLETLNATLVHDPIKGQFREFLQDNKDALAQNKIVTYNEDGHHFINWSRANMLTIGAVRQLYKKMEDLVEKNLQLESKLALLTA